MKIQIINRLSEIMPQYDAVISSAWGVVYDGRDAYPRTQETLERLKSDGKRIIFLSNCPKRVKDMEADLSAAGITRDLYYGLMTAGEAIYYEMAEKNSSLFKTLGTCYYYIGPSNLKDSWIELGYIPVKSLKDAEFIIVTGVENVSDSIDRYLSILRDAANEGLPLVCVSPDRNMSLSGVEKMCAGGIAYRYEMMGGLVIYRGKPQEDFFNYCIEGLGPDIERSRVLVVGDRFSSDIVGAGRSKLNSVFVASGTHARELGFDPSSLETKPLPEMVINDLARHFGAFPKYAIRDFRY